MFFGEGLNLVHKCQISHFPTWAPNLVWTDSEKHGLYGHGSNIIMKYLLLYLISGWAQGHCEPKFHAHHSGLEFVCLQCIASGRQVLAPFRALPTSPQLGKRRLLPLPHSPHLSSLSGFILHLQQAYKCACAKLDGWAKPTSIQTP